MPNLFRVSPLAALVVVALAFVLTPNVRAQPISPTSFTYQGVITSSELPVTNSVTLGFTLFADATGGTPLAPQIVVPNVTPDANGAFSVPLDFGSTYFRDGTPRYIEIAVIEADNSQVPLSPRQAIHPAPLASGIAGVAVLPGAIVVDVDQTQTSQESTFGAGGTQEAYQSFTCSTYGTLQTLTLRMRRSPFVTLYYGLHRGVGPSGAAIASGGIVTGPSSTHDELVLDLSSQNIQVAPGDVFTLTIFCGTIIDLASAAAPGASGQDVAAHPVNFWFRSTVLTPVRVSECEHSAIAAVADLATHAETAATADFATTATVATTATTATTAGAATTAEMLVASGTSALQDHELRLRNASDASHGLGWFGSGIPFRTTGVAPDGPVLFGYGGGALGTCNEGTGASSIALRWNSTAQVGIGTAPSSAGYRLELPNTAGPAGQGRANAWVTYSSRSYKHNIQTIRDPIDLVSQLRGVRFDWNAPTADGLIKHDIGFIAEEIAQVLPDLVTRDAGGNATGLDYGRVVPVAIEAIKQQQAQIAQQQDQIKMLRDQLDRMEQRLNELDRSAR